MAVSWASKDASEVRSYSYSWLGRLNGDTIASATLTVDEGTVTLSSVANTTTSISAKVTGGIAGEDVVLLSTVVTAAGLTLEQAITLSIKPSTDINLGPSTSTKRQLVEMAYEECSLAGYEFNVTPDELFSGLRRLDALMSQPPFDRLNYNAPAIFGQGDLEDYSGIPDLAIGGTVSMLAEAIAPMMGKNMSAAAMSRKSSGMIAIRAATAIIPTVPYRYGTPRGAGRRYPWPSPFLGADE
jgi:hypothetical protein